MKSGGIGPYLERSSNLGKTATLAELVEGGFIPGREGVTLTDRAIRFGDVHRLTEQNPIEYALTRETIGGTRVFRLYSGGRNAVTVPNSLDVRVIGHTHPSGSRWPSRADINAVNKRFLDLVESDPYARVPHERVIFGPGNRDSTTYYPTLLR